MLRKISKSGRFCGRRLRTGVCVLGCAFFLGTAGAVCIPWGEAAQVRAAESSVVESLSVTFEPVWGDPEEILEPRISVSGKGVSLTEIKFRTDPEDWRPGKKVRVELSITAEEGMYVPESMKASGCKIKGASFVSAKGVDDRTLLVRTDYIPVSVLGAPKEAGWSGSAPGKAVWSHVKYAPGYSLALYGNDRLVKKLTVTDNSADLSAYMKDPDKYYYYEVKAAPVTSLQKKYLKEGEAVISDERILDEEAMSAPPEFLYEGEDSGSLKGDHYVYPNGSKAADTWKQVDGKWYYFGGDGSRSRGWLNYGGRWYYMDGNGVMQTGWIFPGDGFWYYLSPDGAMVTGWAELSPNRWYYLNPDGRMHTGWLLDKGSWYYMNSGGDMAVNTVIEGWRIGPDGVARKE